MNLVNIAKNQANVLTPEQMLKEISALAEQVETLTKSMPMFKAEGDEDMPPIDGAPEGDMPPAPEGAPEGDMPPAPEGEPALEDELVQGAEGDDAELRELFGDMEVQDLESICSFIVKLIEEKTSAAAPADAPVDGAPPPPGMPEEAAKSFGMAMDKSIAQMQKSQKALVVQIENLTKSVSTLTEKVAKAPTRPVSRPAVMNSGSSLTKSEKAPEMLAKSDVATFLGNEVRKGGKDSSALLGLFQDVSYSEDSPAEMRKVYAKAEKMGVKIPLKSIF